MCKFVPSAIIAQGTPQCGVCDECRGGNPHGCSASTLVRALRTNPLPCPVPQVAISTMPEVASSPYPPIPETPLEPAVAQQKSFVDPCMEQPMFMQHNLQQQHHHHHHQDEDDDEMEMCCVGGRLVKTWKDIDVKAMLAVGGNNCLPKGERFGVYDASLTSFFDVPSEDILLTHGAIRYAEHYNECGPYTRFRFQLCLNNLKNACTKGGNCTYIHAAKLPIASNVHVNGISAGYPTMQSGVVMYVHLPNSNAPPQQISSESMLRTAGAEAIMTCIVNGTSLQIKRPQHCAHFIYKKICNRGPLCQFLHIPNHIWKAKQKQQRMQKQQQHHNLRHHQQQHLHEQPKQVFSQHYPQQQQQYAYVAQPQYYQTV